MEVLAVLDSSRILHSSCLVLQSSTLPFTDWQNDLRLILGIDHRVSSLLVARCRYTNNCCYQGVFWRSFHWLLRRSERLCLPPRSTPAVTTSCLPPWPAYAFCWAGLLMPRARTACSLRAPRTTSLASQALVGPGSIPTTWSLTATRARPSARTTTWW